MQQKLKFETMPWAKRDGQNVLSLVDHSADVAAVFAALLEQGAWRQRLDHAAGRSVSAQDIQRLCALAFLHDFGKCNAGFQRRADPAAPMVGHTEQAVPATFPDIGDALVDAFFGEVFDGWGAGELVAATLAHHGKPLRGLHCPLVNGEPDERDTPNKQAEIRRNAGYWRPDGAYAPLQALGALTQEARRRYPTAFDAAGRLPEAPAFIALFAGLLTLADWVGSDTTRFPIETVQDRAAFAAHAAREAIRDLGLDRFVGRAPTDFKTAFGFAPRSAQIDAAGFGLGRVAVLEAETGSGKTEAALWRFARLADAGEVDALYFALPTRGAASQLHDRLRRDMRRLFGDAAPSPVLAAPGYVRAGDVDGRRVGRFDVIWDDERKDPARWAAETPRRFLAARVAVGTVDQALLAALPVRHAHLRGAALSRALLVVDEVHASDAYMTELLEQLIANHTACGGHVLLLSATLGSAARAKLTGRAAPALDVAMSIPYPSVSGSDADPVPTEGGGGKIVRVDLAPIMSAPEAIAAWALAAADAGASVLIIRNTVGDVRLVQEALEAAGRPDLLFTLGGVATVHHGRFAPTDRRALDGRVEEVFGKDASGRAPMVLVGSQTLEMSLDIDADLLICDLAPMDVLLQRFGRLHRHDRARPSGYETPVCVVLTPTERDLRPLQRRMRHGLGPFDDGSGIYPDLGVIEATLSLLEAQDVICVPQDCRRLVEGATHPEAVAAAADVAGLDRSRTLGAASAERSQGRQLRLDIGVPFSAHLFPDEEKIGTRLGLEDRRVVLAAPIIGPFGAEIDVLVIPGHMARGIPPDAEAEATSEDGFTSLEIGGLRFGYDRLGLDRHS
jgi:CRISPR-associated endonuclease/helicase Cas3